MAKLQVNRDNRLSKMKPLHGITNGPICAGGLWDFTDLYQDMGVPYVRLHDTEWPYPAMVDVPTIFKDFEKDENDPASYDFRLTDIYLKAIVDAGIKIIYRLGTSIEHNKERFNIYPPKDFAKWARVCEHIIRHYNEGWANGFKYDIQYWEIWNEPEDNNGTRRCMWLGTQAQYFELYKITASHLKTCFGDDIQVGGYASVGLYGVKEGASDYHKMIAQYFFDFIDYVKVEKIPLDFFSFHYYGFDPVDLRLHSAKARETLDAAGYEKTVLILDEWQRGFEYENYRTMQGAMFVLRSMMEMQCSYVDIATYYDGQPLFGFCGLYDGPTKRKYKPYWAFKMYNELYKLQNQVETVCDHDKLHVLAAANDTEMAVVLVNESEEGVALACNFTVKKAYITDECEDFSERHIGEGEVLIPAKSLILLEA